MKRILLLLLLPLWCALPLMSQAVPTDSVRLSLLTCGPGEEIYSLFGHTALRYQRPARGIDVVFNYGLFNFRTPNFVLRFTLGETDYLLGVTDSRYFILDYTLGNRWVDEQELNLTTEEKAKLIHLLEENYRPENRTYRYNFFYDNCATRPRDKVEAATAGSVVYANNMESRDTGLTFRQLLRHYCKGHPWARFGIDLCMGPDADKPITRREATFVPFLLQEQFAQATVKDSAGTERPLLKPTIPLVKPTETADNTDSDSFLNRLLDIATPMRCAWTLLTILAIVTVFEWRRQKTWWGIDAALHTGAGLAGCILAFLAMFSSHPAVSPNYLLFVFHPLYLIGLFEAAIRQRKGRISLFMGANLVVLTFFILLWPVIPQKFPPEVLPLALCLWVRSASHVAMTRKQIHLL